MSVGLSNLSPSIPASIISTSACTRKVLVHLYHHCCLPLDVMYQARDIKQALLVRQPKLLSKKSHFFHSAIS